MTVTDQVLDAFYAYTKKHNMAADRVYLGHKQWHRLQEETFGGMYGEGSPDGRQRCAGLVVVRAAEQDHLSVVHAGD